MTEDEHGITREEHSSPDGKFRLLVRREPGDSTVGFDGYSWHTHGDVIAGELWLAAEAEHTPEAATRRFVRDILAGVIPIVVLWRGDQIVDVWATYLPETRAPDADERLEFRLWDGSSWVSE